MAEPGENCSVRCATRDHRSFGECLRAKALRIGYCQSAKGLDKTRQDKWDRELGEFERARDAGIMPDGTTTAKSRFAMDMSEKYGARYGVDFKVIPRDRSENPKYDAVFEKDKKAVLAEVDAADGGVLRETARELRKKIKEGA